MSQNGAGIDARAEELRQRMTGWALDLTVREAYPSVLIAPKSHRSSPGEESLVILHADGLERHQVIAILRQAVRQLGGQFAG